MSGGSCDGHQGIGIILYKRFREIASQISFRHINPRLCSLELETGSYSWGIISIYLPNNINEEFSDLYEQMTNLVEQWKKERRYIIILGDFNAHIGPLQRNEDEFLVGKFGLNQRNDLGDALVEFV